MTYRFVNHPLGTTWANADYKLAFLNIPKNASTAIKKFLEPYGFRRTPQLGGDGWQVFTVLREPFGRYVSGLAEYALRKGYDPIMVAKKSADLMARGLWTPFDEHTVPQHAFITIPVDQVFRIEEVGRYIPPWLKARGVPIKEETVPRGRTSNKETLNTIRDIVRDGYQPDPVDDLLWRATRLLL